MHTQQDSLEHLAETISMYTEPLIHRQTKQQASRSKHAHFQVLVELVLRPWHYATPGMLQTCLGEYLRPPYSLQTIASGDLAVRPPQAQPYPAATIHLIASHFRL